MEKLDCIYQLKNRKGWHEIDLLYLVLAFLKKCESLICSIYWKSSSFWGHWTPMGTKVFNQFEYFVIHSNSGDHPFIDPLILVKIVANCRKSVSTCQIHLTIHKLTCRARISNLSMTCYLFYLILSDKVWIPSVVLCLISRNKVS